MINSNRIITISELINDAKLVVDIGSDHAQLSTILISQNKSQKVINVEKNINPYNNSVNNTKKYSSRIENILSDGFEKVDKNLEIDYLTISGMGAKTMIDIICKSENKLTNIILCPNNNENIIREFAKNNFYKIKKDLTIYENNQFYTLIWMSKDEGYKIRTKKEIFLGNKKNKKEDKNFVSFIENKITKLEKIPNLKNKNRDKYKELQIYKKWYKKWK